MVFTCIKLARFIIFYNVIIYELAFHLRIIVLYVLHVTSQVTHTYVSLNFDGPAKLANQCHSYVDHHELRWVFHLLSYVLLSQFSLLAARKFEALVEDALYFLKLCESFLFLHQ